MNEEKEMEKFEAEVIAQVDKEYRACYKALSPKITEWLSRLKVYNNQRRQKDKVGDPLLFTVFQTIFASLYDDGLNVEWLPREEGDIDKAENLNMLSEFDNEEMKKDELDYEWDFDTMFFGRGVVCMMEWDSEKKVPVPEVWSPMVLLRDPEAHSVNGNINGRGGCRFIGRETNQLKWELEKHPSYFNIDKIGKEKTDQQSLHAKKERARREAMGLADTHPDEVGENAYTRTLQWFTYIDGERYFVELANNRETLIRFQKLADQDRWPLMDRSMFPMANDWDGVSIPDLVEDKQRARAVLLNAGLDIAKANSNPMYLFDVNRIKRRDQLNYEFNKFVPVEGQPRDAVVPMMKERISTDTQYIFSVLDESVQRALATPELQQGATPRRSRTLGELELMSAKVDTRYSLAAKIFGWSEKRFWNQWYMLYSEHFDEDVSEKIIRLKGVFGSEFKKIKRSDIVGTEHPDIKVESEAIVRAQKAIDRNVVQEYLGFGSQIPGFNVRYAMKEMGRLSNFTKGKIDQLMPPVYDEIIAEEENRMINENKEPRVLLTDSHLEHIAIHAKAKDNEKRELHIKAHKMAVKIIHENPGIFDPATIGEGPPTPMGAPGAAPPTGEEVPQEPTNIPQSYQQGMPMGGQE